MPIYDVSMLVEIAMRVEAYDAREAQDIVIAACYAPMEERIRERNLVDVRDESARLVEGAP